MILLSAKPGQDAVFTVALCPSTAAAAEWLHVAATTNAMCATQRKQHRWVWGIAFIRETQPWDTSTASCTVQEWQYASLPAAMCGVTRQRWQLNEQQAYNLQIPTDAAWGSFYHAMEWLSAEERPHNWVQPHAYTAHTHHKLRHTCLHHKLSWDTLTSTTTPSPWTCNRHTPCGVATSPSA